VVRQRARERIAPVATSSGAGVGFTFNMSLLGMHDTGLIRLRAQFPLYERYHVRSLKVHWVPAVSSFRDGQIHMAFDYDPYDPVDTEPTHLAGMRGYHAMRVNQPFTFAVPNPVVPGGYLREGLFTGPTSDLRFSVFGNFLAYVEGVEDGLVPGHFDLEYDIDLINPQPLTGAPQIISHANQAVYVTNESALTHQLPARGPFPLIETPAPGQQRPSFDVTCPVNGVSVGQFTGILEGENPNLLTAAGGTVPQGTRLWWKLSESQQEFDPVSDHAWMATASSSTKRPTSISFDPAGLRPVIIKIISGTAYALLMNLLNVKRIVTPYE